MQRNVPLRTIIQDLKSEYPDISEQVIADVVETFNRSLPSIRATLDRHRAVNLQCNASGNMTRTHHRSGDAVPSRRPISIPNFQQFSTPLSVDVNNDHLPSSYQMETYIDHGLRPLPNQCSSSPRIQTDYVNQQRHCLSLLENEVGVLERYLRSVQSDVRCREQLYSQREFGSDQRFPSKSDVDRLRQELARIRWEAEYLDRSRNNQYIPNVDSAAYPSHFRPNPPGSTNSVSAPGTPDAPYSNRVPRQSHVYNPSNYQPTVYPYFHHGHQVIPHPPIPPNRSYSARPPTSLSPRPPQPSCISPANQQIKTNTQGFRRGHSRTPSDGSRSSRPSSHRNSQASVGEVVPEPADEEEKENWSCSKCTFSNHPIMRVCEMCETPRAKPADL